jgi:hypothetical protein
MPPAELARRAKFSANIYFKSLAETHTANYIMISVEIMI